MLPSLSSPGALPLPGESAGRRRLPRGTAPASAPGGLLSSPGGPFLSLPALSPLRQGKREETTGTGREDPPPPPGARGKALPRLRRLAVCDLSEPLCPFSSYPAPSPARPPLSPPRPTDARRLTLPGAPAGTPLASPAGFIPPPPPRLMLNQHVQIPAAPGRRGRWSRPPSR